LDGCVAGERIALHFYDDPGQFAGKPLAEDERSVN
jgi:hypothetical protein